MVGCGDGPLPDRGERLLVEAVIELGDARSYRLVAQPDRTAPVVPRPVGGVDGSQGQHEVSQVERGLHGVVELVERRHGAGEPLHDAPRVGEGLVGLAQRDGHRHGQREMRGDHGQPGLLLGHGVHRPVDAREPHGEVVAEPVERVVRPRRRHPLDGQVRPLRVLARPAAGAPSLRPCRPRRRASSAGPRGATQPDRPRTAERISPVLWTLSTACRLSAPTERVGGGVDEVVDRTVHPAGCWAWRRPAPDLHPVLTPPARGGRGGLEPSGCWSFALSGGALGSVGPKGRRRRGAAMTTQKTFKRRVRDRMAKTGESYTAARRQLIAAGDQPDPGTPTYETVVSDEKMLEATGRRHEEWFAILDAWGGTERTPHRDRPPRDRGARRRRLVGPEHHRVLRAGPGPAGRRPDEGRLDDQRQQDVNVAVGDALRRGRGGPRLRKEWLPDADADPPHRHQAEVGSVRLGGRQHPASS